MLQTGKTKITTSYYFASFLGKIYMTKIEHSSNMSGVNNFQLDGFRADDHNTVTEES